MIVLPDGLMIPRHIPAICLATYTVAGRDMLEVITREGRRYLVAPDLCTRLPVPPHRRAAPAPPHYASAPRRGCTYPEAAE